MSQPEVPPLAVTPPRSPQRGRTRGDGPDGSPADTLEVELPAVRHKGAPVEDSPASDATTDEDREPPPPPGT